MSETMQLSMLLVAGALAIWILLGALLSWRREFHEWQFDQLEQRTAHALAVEKQRAQLELDKAETDLRLKNIEALASYITPFLAELGMRLINSIYPPEPLPDIRERPTVPEDGEETAE